AALRADRFAVQRPLFRMCRPAASGACDRSIGPGNVRESDADLDFVSRLRGDVLILGASGKMGPSLAIRINRAVTQRGSRNRVIAVSRFSNAAARTRLDAQGIRTIACDLLDPRQTAALPWCENVFLMAGRKFGTADRTDLTWATNTVAPARIAE